MACEGHDPRNSVDGEGSHKGSSIGEEENPSPYRCWSWNVNLHHQTPYKLRVCAPGGIGGQSGGM